MKELKDLKTEIFRAMAHPTRIHILDALRDGEKSVMELCGLIGLQHSNVSQQLSILRNNNLVNTRKEGNAVFYSIKDKAVFKILDLCKEIIDNNLTSLQSQIKLGKASILTLWFALVKTTNYFIEAFEMIPIEFCS